MKKVKISMSCTIPILVMLVLLLLTSCEREAKEKVETSNPLFNVELLFEVDGCKVYRFEDGGRTRYFTTCQGSVNWSERYGKNSTVNIEVPTGVK